MSGNSAAAVRRAAVLVAVCVACPAAGAQAGARRPLPSYVPMPPGFSVMPGAGREIVVEYGRDDFDYQPGPNQPKKRISAEGHNWIVYTRATPAPATRLDQAGVNALVLPLLGAQGWEILAERPWIIARREKGGVISWVKMEGNSDYWGVRVIEQAPRTRTLVLPAPAAQAEELKGGVEPAYLGHFPGSTVHASDLMANDAIEFRIPGEKEANFVGRPLWKADYRGPVDLSPFELNLVYSEALENAGWKIVQNTGGSSTGDAVLRARFVTGTRDLWLSIHAINAGYDVSLADAAAAAEMKRLKDELDRLGHVAVYGIYFDSDSSKLKPESEATLSQILKLLDANPSLKLGIEGHTDNTGARPHNQVLSEQRAASVVRYLVDHKVNAARLTAAGFADTRPVADNGSPDGRAKNRRVELVKK
jgi:OOP family OmpA-OmpF porin